MNAKAIAFSPRCSADPLYENSKRLEVTFQHYAMNEKKLKNRVNPIVIVDPQVPADKKFLEQRILPLYKENISLVELPGSTHHTARAMSSQGLLKDFVLNIIHFGQINSINFDAMSNAISLSSMALSSAKNKRFDDANRYLQRLISVGKQPNEAMRLEAYLILSEEGRLTHNFDKSNIFPAEKKTVYNRQLAKFKKSKNPRDILLAQTETYIKLLEFKKAIDTAKEAINIFPGSEEIRDVLERSKRLYTSTEGVLF